MADNKTIEMLLNDFESQGTDIKNVTIVMDAAFATEENLKMIENNEICCSG